MSKVQAQTSSLCFLSGAVLGGLRSIAIIELTTDPRPPLMLQYASDINKGLNVPADNLMFCGALLCLAASLIEKSASPGKSMAG